MNIILKAVTVSCLTVAAPAAFAQTVYTTPADFAAATSSLTTETFTGATVAGAVVTTPGFTVTGVSPTFNTGFYSPPSIGTYPGDVPVTFTFNSAITAFGLNIIDLGTVGATTLTATFDGGSVALVSNFTGGGANTLFRGFTSATPFLSVTLTNAVSGDYVEFDNVAFGAAGATVPEPATWAMMILGMGAAGSAMRRRRTRARIVFA